MATLSCMADFNWTDSLGITWEFELNASAYIKKVTSATSSTVTLPSAVRAEVSGNWHTYKVKNVSLSGLFSSGIEDLIISPDAEDTLSFDAERGVTIHVPTEKLAIYQGLANVGRQVVAIGAQTDYDLTVTAQDNASSFYDAIGEANMDNVETLKVTGTINGHDISYIRNKMYNLHHLDLTDATIVANDFKYYGNYCTEDSTLTPYAFYGLSNLVSVKLPKSLKGKIGGSAFDGCGHLKEVTIPEGVTGIGDDAFLDAHYLQKITLPKSIVSIGKETFRYCHLREINLPESLKSIGFWAFSGNDFTSLVLPESLEEIGGYAFDISTLTDVYTSRFKPLSIPDKAFTNAANCRLWAPYKKAADGEKADWDAVYRAYYDDAQWGKFQSVNQWEGYTYKRISLGEGEDFEQDKGSAPTTDETSADFGNKSGFINKSEDEQVLDTITVHGDGTDAATIIADGNIDARGLNFDITVQANRWYFFCFPFDISLDDVTCGGHYVFRCYDGSKRALGQSGWTALPEGDNTLHAWKGYIFQTDTPGRLLLKVLKDKLDKFRADDRSVSMEQHQADDVEDASWNFMGNPWTSYFDINDMDYTAPITYWDGTNYQTVRPGDDDYTLHPFEAFFVQKPDGVDGVGFGAGHRHTKNQSADRQASAKRNRLARGIDPQRLIVNLTLTDGTTTDNTRVVYNNNVSADYEIGTDAAKFAMGGTPTLYTLDAHQRHYAINERPDGEVRLGYTATRAGAMTIGSTRMDAPVLLRDNVAGVTFDLANGSYTFDTEAGTFDSRFTLVRNSSATGIADIQSRTGVRLSATDGGIHFGGITTGIDVSIYTLGGAMTTRGVRDGFVALPAGSYVVRVGGMSTKVLVK